MMVISTHAHWHDLLNGNAHLDNQKCHDSRDKIGTRNVISGQNRDGSQIVGPTIIADNLFLRESFWYLQHFTQWKCEVLL